MGQSLSRNIIHMVYSTKNRKKYLSKDLQHDLFGYKSGILRQLRSPAIEVGGAEDHIHLLFVLSKNLSLSKVVEEVKKGSTKWMKSNFPDLKNFAWQGGFGAFSVSPSMLINTQNYIRNQNEHHKKFSFKDELRLLFRKHAVAFDERYLWD